MKTIEPLNAGELAEAVRESRTFIQAAKKRTPGNPEPFVFIFGSKTTPESWFEWRQKHPNFKLKDSYPRAEKSEGTPNKGKSRNVSPAGKRGE
jgi:hypothetical protein